MVDGIKKLVLAAVWTSVLAALQPRLHFQLKNKQAIEADAPQQPSYMISFYDLMQNQQLQQLKDSQDKESAELQETNKNLVQLERDISDMQGANRVWFWLLAGMITGIGVMFWRSVTTKGEK